MKKPCLKDHGEEGVEESEEVGELLVTGPDGRGRRHEVDSLSHLFNGIFSFKVVCFLGMFLGSLPLP
jgi:hypothetical protein